MDQELNLAINMGNNAICFGLGLLASKKLRPFAKYFIVGGIAASVTPMVMQLIEENKYKKATIQNEVEEIVLETLEETAAEEEAEAEEADAEEAVAEVAEEETKEVETES